MSPLQMSSLRSAIMSPRIIAATMACVLAVAAHQARAVTLGGSAALTTDYVWRGTSQSNEDPAVQAGFKASGAGGFYAQAWASSVDFAASNDADTEVDLIVGWAGNLSDTWAIDVNATHYRYPSTSVDLDWTELNATLTWHGNYWLQVAHSNDALAGGEAGTYALAGARFPLSDTFRLEAAAGHYWLDPDSGYDDYAHVQFGAAWAFKAPFELRVTVHDTDSTAERVFGDWAGSRVEAALQASF